MKIKIKSFNGELPSYLTEGKEYKVEKVGFLGFWITVDNEIFEACVLLDDCSFLNGGSWEVVNDN